MFGDWPTLARKFVRSALVNNRYVQSGALDVEVLTADAPVGGTAPDSILSRLTRWTDLDTAHRCRKEDKIAFRLVVDVA